MKIGETVDAKGRRVVAEGYATRVGSNRKLVSMVKVTIYPHGGLAEPHVKRMEKCIWDAIATITKAS